VDQGDVAVIIEDDSANLGQFVISAYLDFDSSPSSQYISYSYLSACDLAITGHNLATSAYISCNSDSYSVCLPSVTAVASLVIDTVPTVSASHSLHTLLVPLPDLDTPSRDPDVGTFASRKYKPVARKIRPVLADKSFELYETSSETLWQTCLLYHQIPPLSLLPEGIQPTTARSSTKYIRATSFGRKNANSCITSCVSRTKDSRGTIRREAAFARTSSHQSLCQSSSTDHGFFAICRFRLEYTKMFAKSLKQKWQLEFMSDLTQLTDRDGSQYSKRAVHHFTLFTV
jgi:hypothetical protein